MNNRNQFIDLIKAYGVEWADPKSTLESRMAAMKAVEDFCDAQILDERAACAAIADELAKEADRRLEAMEQAGDDSAATEAAGRAESAATITDRIRARPAP